LSIPKNIINIVLERYEKFPIALTGCRTTDLALECCEYDFIILSDENIHEVCSVNGSYVEIHSMQVSQSIHTIAPYLQNMHIVNDPSWILATLKQDIATVLPKALWSYSRSLVVDALFYANKSREAVNDRVQLASLWLKSAAYYYLEALIARNDSKAMPVHMLSQLRAITEGSESNGIAIANTCLGLERANRSSVSRCMEAAIGLNQRTGQNTELISHKARFLMESAMYTDSYSYLGYASRDAALKLTSNQKTAKDYMFMTGIAMDLIIDPAFIAKQANDLLDACNSFLLA
jgi:hypothetical protein